MSVAPQDSRCIDINPFTLRKAKKRPYDFGNFLLKKAFS